MRNEERIKAATKGTSKRGAHRSCWSLEEEEQLALLELQYQGERTINKLIPAGLGSKTNKQVADKRRCLTKKKGDNKPPITNNVSSFLETSSTPPSTTTGARAKLVQAAEQLSSGAGGHLEKTAVDVIRA